MKFGKRLSNQIEETLPEWRDKFLSYKDLKKRLKLIEPKDAGDRAPAAKRQRIFDTDSDKPRSTAVSLPEEDGMSKEEADFIKLLEGELEKFNTFFIEKEEEYIIRLKEFQDRLKKAKTSPEDLLNVRKEIVDFHGEMVLLENYSALNYTGLVKILKKYDKRTGALIRLPFIQKVLQQPFFTTDLIFKLVKQCERMLDVLFCTIAPSVGATVDTEDPSQFTTTSGSTTITTSDTTDGLLKGSKELAEIEYMESLYMKSTVSALRSLKEIRSHSSTVSEFSLPPLQLNGIEETWKKIPILEQVAK